MKEFRILIIAAHCMCTLYQYHATMDVFVYLHCLCGRFWSKNIFGHGIKLLIVLLYIDSIFTIHYSRLHILKKWLKHNCQCSDTHTVRYSKKGPSLEWCFYSTLYIYNYACHRDIFHRVLTGTRWITLA